MNARHWVSFLPISTTIKWFIASQNSFRLPLKIITHQ